MAEITGLRVGGASLLGRAPEPSSMGGTASHQSYGFHLPLAQGSLQMVLTIALRFLSLGLSVLSELSLVPRYITMGTKAL